MHLRLLWLDKLSSCWKISIVCFSQKEVECCIFRCLLKSTWYKSTWYKRNCIDRPLILIDVFTMCRRKRITCFSTFISKEYRKIVARGVTAKFSRVNSHHKFLRRIVTLVSQYYPLPRTQNEFLHARAERYGAERIEFPPERKLLDTVDVGRMRVRRKYEIQKRDKRAKGTEKRERRNL